MSSSLLLISNSWTLKSKICRKIRCHTLSDPTQSASRHVERPESRLGWPVPSNLLLAVCAGVGEKVSESQTLASYAKEIRSRPKNRTLVKERMPKILNTNGAFTKNVFWSCTGDQLLVTAPGKHWNQIRWAESKESKSYASLMQILYLQWQRSLEIYKQRSFECWTVEWPDTLINFFLLKSSSKEVASERLLAECAQK